MLSLTLFFVSLLMASFLTVACFFVGEIKNDFWYGTVVMFLASIAARLVFHF